MKRNILPGMLLIGALALSSCSTTQLASSKVGKDDDVYFSEAKAGDAPVYVANNQPQQQNRYNNYNDDDYYYYNSYSSRINRFGYYSPFSYYNDIYSGYSPYYSPYYGAYSGIGFGIGLGLGGYYGYNPYYYGGAYGYNPYYGSYYPYGYGVYGGGYGYAGGYGSYVTYGAVNTGSPRPYRGSGAPANGMVNRSVNNIGYNGNYPVNTAYPGRPVAVGSTNSSNGGRQVTNTYGNNTNNTSNARPTRDDAPRQVYTPQVQSSPPPSSSGSSSSGSSGGGGGGGGGGARPVRP